MTLLKTKNSIPSVFSDLFNNERFFDTDLFDREFGRWIPAVNVKENGKQFNIELAAPGFSKSDFKINVEGDVLSISAEKKEEKKDENERYTKKEFSYNSFTRSFTLPQSVKSEKIDAKYDNGVLTLIVPKKEESAVSSAKKEIKVS